MATPLTINGTAYQFPQQFDRNWGPTVTNWATAVTNGMLQKAGGTFTLTSEVNFGATYGVKMAYLKSSGSNIASTGFLRMPNNNTGLVWRNAANNGDLALTVNASNQLTFNGTPIAASSSLTDTHIYVGNASNQPTDVAVSGDISITNLGAVTIANSAITDAKVSSSAAITLSKLAPTTAYYWYAANVSGVLTPLGVTASRAVATDANGLPTASATTATELGYLSGVTSAIQTQLGTKLTKSGDTMSGNLNMGSNNIVSLAAGTASGQAVAYRQGSQAVNGSTANSGGSAGTIQQGTISTPDMRANAVTKTGQTFGSLAGPAPLTITTLGGPVLVTVTALASMATTHVTSPPAPSATNTCGGDLDLILDGSTTLCSTSFHFNNLTTTTNSFSFSAPLSLTWIDTPSAGSHTYSVDFTGTTGTIVGVTYVISAVELRA